ncbi:MAG TPA: GlsB/YeaQ/YmgE family stress response membrane protein [Chthoniobacteraceae bacterium]|jgi:uncharacterized membrane protein YeaQ/YmgE (transglycosylase-associated protein family)|nr:GlsB/YeaQ/YmgE family stress response membrane protein [Chthoniobacteraceae bacterium]
MLALFDFLHIGNHGLISSLILGLIIGIIAKLLMPGKDPGGCVITSLLGIAGAAIGSLIASKVLGWEGSWGGIILGIVGTLILLALYHVLFVKKGS